MSRLLGAATSKHVLAAGEQSAARTVRRAARGADGPVVLTDLGLLLVPGPPLNTRPAYLMAALRPRPRQQTDPREIAFWSFEGARPTRVELMWPIPEAGPRYGWGTIEITDCVGIERRFVSFGGTMTVSRDLDVHAALFRSDAPILALADPPDPATSTAREIDAFLAHLRSASFNSSHLRRLTNRLTPVSAYAAFVSWTLARARQQSPDTRSTRTTSVLRMERARLERDFPVDAAAALRLVAALGDGRTAFQVGGG